MHAGCLHRSRFFSAVAKCLRGAEQILIFGTGIGASTAKDQLLEELKLNHRDVARHVVGAVAIDQRHLTEEQLLARARSFCCSALPPCVPGPA